MKTIQFRFKTLLILLLVSFAFTSCSSDDSVNNQAPNNFNLIEVADGATNVGLQPQLTWEAATDPDGDDVTYQVYLDTQNPPRISIASSLGVSTFSLEDEIQPETIYFWKVVAKDSNGNSTKSNAASFTSREMTTSEAIIGKWSLESIIGNPPLSECRKKGSFQFTENLILQRIAYQEDGNGICAEAYNGTFTYKIIGSNQLEISNENNSEIWRIQSLTETTLVLDVSGQVATFEKE